MISAVPHSELYTNVRYLRLVILVRSYMFVNVSLIDIVGWEVIIKIRIASQIMGTERQTC